MLVDPRDEELPDVGLATFEDLETGEEVVVDTGDRARARALRDRRCAACARERDKLFKKLALDAVVVRTDESFVEPLRKLFAEARAEDPAVTR